MHTKELKVTAHWQVFMILSPRCPNAITVPGNGTGLLLLLKGPMLNIGSTDRKLLSMKEETLLGGLLSLQANIKSGQISGKQVKGISFFRTMDGKSHSKI